MGPWHPRRRAWGVAPPTVAPPPCMGRWRRRRRAWGVAPPSCMGRERKRDELSMGREMNWCEWIPGEWRLLFVRAGYELFMGREMNRKDGAEGKEPAGCHNFPSALMRPIEYK